MDQRHQLHQHHHPDSTADDASHIAAATGIPAPLTASRNGNDTRRLRPQPPTTAEDVDRAGPTALDRLLKSLQRNSFSGPPSSSTSATTPTTRPRDASPILAPAPRTPPPTTPPTTTPTTPTTTRNSLGLLALPPIDLTSPVECAFPSFHERDLERDHHQGGDSDSDSDADSDDHDHDHDDMQAPRHHVSDDTVEKDLPAVPLKHGREPAALEVEPQLELEHQRKLPPSRNSSLPVTAAAVTTTTTSPLPSLPLHSTATTLATTNTTADPRRERRLTMSMLGAAAAIKKQLQLTASQSLPSHPSHSIQGQGNPSNHHHPSKVHMDSVDVHSIPLVSLPGFNLHESTTTLSTKATPTGAQPPTPPPPGMGGLLRRISSRLVRGGGGKDADHAHDSESQVTRKRSMVRPERSRLPRQDLLTLGGISVGDAPTYLQAKRAAQRRKLFKGGKLGSDGSDESDGREWTPWLYFAHAVTCCVPSVVLDRCCGMHNHKVRVAWREKMGLVTIIALMCAVLAFITFGFQAVACGVNGASGNGGAGKYTARSFNPGTVTIRGDVYDVSRFTHPGGKSVADLMVAGRDVSWMFPVIPASSPSSSQPTDGEISACAGFPAAANDFKPTCAVDDVPGAKVHCHSDAEYLELLGQVKRIGQLRYDWADIRRSNTNGNTAAGNTKLLLVYNGQVLNVNRYFREGNGFLSGNGSSGGTSSSASGASDFDRLLVGSLGKDATHAFARTKELKAKMACLVETFRVGYLQVESTGCFMSQVR